MNQFTTSGWVTKTPESGPTNKGQYCNFTIGVLETRRKRDNAKGTFLPFVCYNDVAERIKKTVTKGTYIVIEDAEAIVDTWTDKNGNEKSVVKFQVFKFIIPASFSGGSKENTEKTLKEAFDDLPFDN